ncbi:hypothetical protein CORC01_06733 [Colletotrichum orchidophilum]|uniref:Uncharacterized protein n=1 Tax=Colletotrichum orchidophilum TaxID=1209926 RepID=A0A1G4B8V7_9PEZI|nr:uncharacterized protein CORC01_06733 [Colletotrichum orchidophilum]OHE97870.1 hypothetical protein CORC01_06733 [Colletotrichum orchidophilum]
MRSFKTVLPSLSATRARLRLQSGSESWQATQVGKQTTECCHHDIGKSSRTNQNGITPVHPQSERGFIQ